MKKTLFWFFFLFCVYKSLDYFVLSGRLIHWAREKAAARSLLGNQTARQALEREVKVYTNPLSIHLISGRVMEGEIIGEDDQTVTIRQRFGHTGYLDETLPRSEIQEVVENLKGSDEITPEELSIKQEFPQFHMVKRADYTFFTDSDYFFIERIVTLLERLHQEFVKEFGALAGGEEKRRSYVIIFGNEQTYQKYAKKVSAALEHSAGFYTFGGRRLALYNQFQSALFGDWEKAVEEIRGEIKQHREELERYRGIDPQRSYEANEAILKAEERLGRHQQRINAAFDETTVMVILHEGSHQLFHASGLHATSLARLPWFVEGLATYCETPLFGGRNRMREVTLRGLLQTGTLIPLSDFLRFRSESSFMKEGERAYAQAWSFIYFLMKEHRQEFFRYLQRVNRPSKALFVSDRTPIEWLEEELGKGLPEIEGEWREFIQKLI